MNKYKFLYLIWLLPAYFIWQAGYQLYIYNGLNDTYQNGESYIAEVLDFDIKQIAAQTNGYVIIRFSDSRDQVVEEKLSLPVQMAQVLMDSETIPVRYKEDSQKPIVIVSVYELQKDVLRVNMAVSGISLFVVVVISFFSTRYANRMIREGEEEIQIEHV